MKKVLIALSVLAALSASALDPVNNSFFGGNKAIIITNNSTVNFGDSAVFYVAPNRIGLFSGLSNNILPNAYSAAGSQVAFDSPLATSWYYTNSVTANSINNLNPNAWSDIPCGSDRNGNQVAANIAVTFNGINNANTTNLVTFTIGRICDGVNVSTVSNEKITMAQALANGTTAVTYSTNLPSTFVQGATKLRLLSIAVNNVSSSSYVIVSNVTLNYFSP